MYNTTAEYKTEIKNPSRSFECKITIGNKIFVNDDIVDIKLDGNIQPSDGFMIGSTTSQRLDLTLLNTEDTIYSTNQIKIEIGLKIGSTIEYIPMGIFNIDDIEKTDYTIKVTAFDNMIKFETGYFSELGDAPVLKDVVNELASKTGVQFIGSLPAYTVSTLEGFTCREILSYVASICGGNAAITREGKFTIVYPEEVNYSINADNYFNYKREEEKYKIGKVTCKVKDKETISKGTLGTDSMELTFENPWVTDSILQDIYNKLKGLEYLGYSMKWQGDLSLDPGDTITCTDKKGVVRKLPILSQKLTYTGGLTAEIGAKGESKNRNSFSANGSNSNKINRVVTDLAFVNKAFVDYANINDANIRELKAGSAKIENAEINIANINTILANFISGDYGQFLHLTSGNVVIDEAVIRELIASKITVADLLAGNIDTNKFNIVSEDGGISIVGATQQFKDKNNKVRLQIGQDAQGNFNFILNGPDGTTTLIDHTGIKENAIADDLIKENMVAENAIGEKQINYSSLVTGFNKDTNTETLKASKIVLDNTNQKLNVAFNEISNSMQAATTELNVHQGQIDTLIANTTITKDGKTTQLKDEYNKTVDTVNSHTTAIGNHTTKINDLEKTTSSHTTEIKQNTDEIALKASKTEVTEAVNNIKVGGENLFHFTDYSKVTATNLFDLTKKTAWQKNGSLSASIVGYGHANNKPQDKFIKGKQVLYLTYPVTSTKQCYINPYGDGGTEYIELKPNTEYVLSGYMYTGGGATEKLYWVIWGYNDDGSNRAVLTQLPDHVPWTGAFEWFEFKFTTDSRKYYQLRLYINAKTDATEGNAACNIYNLKLEEGNKATAWSPSARDTSGEIDKKIVDAKAEIKITTDGITSKVNNIEGSYVTETKLNQEKNNIVTTFSSTGGANMLKNSNFANGLTGWSAWNTTNHKLTLYTAPDGKKAVRVSVGVDGVTNAGLHYSTKELKFISGRKYSLSFKYRSYSGVNANLLTYNYIIHPDGNKALSTFTTGYSYKYEAIGGGYYKIKITFIPDKDYLNASFLIGAAGLNGTTAGTTGIGLMDIMLQEGSQPTDWQPHPTEVYNTTIKMNDNGLRCDFKDGTYTKLGQDGFEWFVGSTGNSYNALTYISAFTIPAGNPGTVKVKLPLEFTKRKGNLKWTVATRGYYYSTTGNFFVFHLHSEEGAMEEINGQMVATVKGYCKIQNANNYSDTQLVHVNAILIAVA